MSLLALAVVMLAAAIAIASITGSGPAPPASGAAAVVPADALAYVHLSTDSRRVPVQQALALGRRFPDFPLASASVITRMMAILSGGRSTDFGSVRSWLGREAALAVLAGPSATADSLIVLDVRNPAGAQAFVAHAGARPHGSYDGVGLLRYPAGGELAFARHYLLVGQDASVRAALDAATGRVPALGSDPAYEQATAGEPAGRVLDAYVSAVGVRRMLAPRRGLLGALGALLEQPALLGTAISLAPSAAGAAIDVRSALDPTVAQLYPSAPFHPTLQNVLPSGSAVMLDTRQLARVAPRVLSAASDIGIGGGIAPLLGRLGAALGAEGVSVQSLLSLFAGETAVAIVPTDGTAALTIVARVRDGQQASGQLAALAPALEQLFPAPAAGSGQVPVLGDQQVAGVDVHRLALAPGLQLDYAVSDGLMVLSTSVRAIGEIAARRHALAADPAYGETLGGGPDRVTSLLFLDFNQLLSLVEQTGLVRSSRLGVLSLDLAKVRAIGLSSTSGKSDSSAELLLKIS